MKVLLIRDLLFAGLMPPPLSNYTKGSFTTSAFR